jgi:hypothetical protein|tara:strand:- start:2386 stop:3168 length:783 start_codon:yes stop_codon:yes gene_type:complete
VQRRRKPKTLPKNIFGKDSNKESKKKTRVATPKTPTPRATPTPTATQAINVQPPSPPQIQSDKKNLKSISKDKTPVEKTDSTKLVKEIIIQTEPIIGDKKTPRESRKGVGLKNNNSKQIIKPSEKVQSDKAVQLIQQSKLRAAQNIGLNKNKPVVKPVVKPPPRPRRRAPKSSYQPANRAKRLDRSRHMEYKYEMRGLLKKLDIIEEHHSGLLGSIWAKGERQTAAEAKLYLVGKLNDGIINEHQSEKLSKIIDEYTIRR